MSQPTYATPADVPGWETDPPETADAWLRMASLLVRQATKTARYPITLDGAPSDPDTAAVFRDATVAQVVYWQENGVDPLTGAGSVRGTGEVEESSIGTGRVKKATANTTVVQERIASLTELVPAARLYLRGFSSEVVVWW